MANNNNITLKAFSTQFRVEKNLRFSHLIHICVKRLQKNKINFTRQNSVKNLIAFLHKVENFKIK